MVNIWMVTLSKWKEKQPGVEIVVVRSSEDYQKLGRTTKDDDSSSPMDYHTIWEYFSNFVFVMLFCLNLGHMTTTYIWGLPDFPTK